jgi:hypothetical protein
LSKKTTKAPGRGVPSELQTGRKNTDVEYLARLEEVEQVLREGRWSLRAQRLLAERHGVSARQLRKDRAKVEEIWRDEFNRLGAQGHKVRLMNEGRALRLQASSQGQYMVAAKILSFEARITGADEPLQIEVSHRVASMTDQELAREVLDVLPELKQIAAIDVAFETVKEPDNE